MGMSDNLEQTWVRAAELKHGRVAMLAVVGFIVSRFVHLPAEQFSADNPLDAFAKVPLAGHLQILSFCGMFELQQIRKMSDSRLITVTDPWQILARDPKGSADFASKPAAEQQRLQTSEIKNGRLAMIAIMGLIVQSFLFGPQP